jgi:uncharacterized protein YceK
MNESASLWEAVAALVVVALVVLACALSGCRSVQKQTIKFSATAPVERAEKSVVTASYELEIR